MLRRVNREIVTHVPKDGFASIFGVKHSNKRKVQIELNDPEVEALGSMKTFYFIHRHGLISSKDAVK
jgi:hypothetical protein